MVKTLNSKRINTVGNELQEGDFVINVHNMQPETFTADDGKDTSNALH